MIITLCILLLVYTLTGKPIGKLVVKLRNADWKQYSDKAWDWIKRFSVKGGRIATKPLLQLYYVLVDKDTSTTDKALILACLVYIISPADLIPRSVFRFLGLLDDLSAAVVVYKKVSNKITPEINAKVEETLNNWFSNDEEIGVKS